RAPRGELAPLRAQRVERPRTERRRERPRAAGRADPFGRGGGPASRAVRRRAVVRGPPMVRLLHRSRRGSGDRRDGGRGGSRSRRAHRWRMRGKEGAVSDSKRIRLARAAYDAYVTGDRGVLEELLSEDFTFSSPYDVGIDRRAYF